MSKKDKEFYVWTMAEYIKGLYESWGIDLMSMYSNIKGDFPNATRAIHKMHSYFKDGRDCYSASPLTFEKPQYVYEAIANLIPVNKELRFDLNTKVQSKEYEYLNVRPWGRFVEIDRIDLVMAVLLFTEDFITQSITMPNVSLGETELTVAGDFVTLKVSKQEEKTYVNIEIKDVIILQYVILN